MSSEGEDFFAPPAFKPEAAMVQLKRALRDQRALVERGGGFVFESNEVLTLAVDGATLVARLARKPLRSPDWDTIVCRDAPAVRKLQDEIRRRLVKWADE